MAGRINILSNQLQYRSLSTSNVRLDAWLSKLLVRKIEPTRESHSRQLGDKESIFALQTHNFKPDSRRNYLDNFKKQVELKTQLFPEEMRLVGSWTVDVGDQDQALHLWQYNGGFKTVDKINKEISQNYDDCLKLDEEQAKFMRSRHLQYLLAFSYWPKVEPRTDSNHIYEIRSYSLKPGTMIEWGNNWARAINHRTPNQEAFAGFFSQVGRLYNVHHIWCYDNLYSRRESRESAWVSPGWDECVAYTVPLIREMHTRILVPTGFSPTK